jgi:hypothetical protein
MGKTAKETEQELQVNPSLNENDKVKVSAIKEYYATTAGGVSVSQVAEHFNVEEADVMRVLGLDKEETDEWNEPKVNAPESDSAE